MSRALITEAYLTDIANAIRTKLGALNPYTPPQMAAAIESIPSGITPTGTKLIMTNGIHDVTQYANVNVDVPNSYAAGDEGKVVSNGALVAQTSRSVTANGTYDTTTNDEVVVNVSGGGSGVVLSGTTAPTSSIGNNEDLYVRYTEHQDQGWTYVYGIDAIYRKVNGAWVSYVDPVIPNLAVHVWTQSTGSSDAAMYVQQANYDSTTGNYTPVGDAVIVVYTAVSGSATFNLFNLATLGYPKDWTIIATENITDGTNTYSSGDTVTTWRYNATKDIYLRWAV